MGRRAPTFHHHELEIIQYLRLAGKATREMIATYIRLTKTGTLYWLRKLLEKGMIGKTGALHCRYSRYYLLNPYGTEKESRLPQRDLDKVLHVRLPGRMLDKLRRKAKRGRVSELVRAMIEHYFNCPKARS